MALVPRCVFHPGAWMAAGIAIVALAAATAWWAWDTLPTPAATRRPVAAATRPTPAPPSIAALDSSVFQPSRGADAPAPDASLAQRYRLAGTFFILDPDLRPAAPRAVVVNRATGWDHVVRAGAVFEGITVVDVGEHHVVLQENGRRETLRLGGAAARRPATAAGAPAGIPDPAAATGAGRFGDRLSENRWVFHRDRLLDYYQEVMGAPQRLMQVFDSMKPLYDADDRITGYVLDIEGETDFFHAVGLREGDVIRSVNDMAMSNRRRAEYLIGEFVKDHLNVFILGIERDGQPIQQIYEVR